MSIDVTEEMITNAQSAIEAKNPYSEDTTQDLLTSVKQSLPAYWKLYEEKSQSVGDLSDDDLAIIYRGLASDAIQFVTSRHFGFRLHRVGDEIIVSDAGELTIEIDSDKVALSAAYPLGMKLIDERIEENAQGENGTVWDPIGTDNEPEADAHLELLGVLSDARLKSWLASQNIHMHFRNCCTTFTSNGNESNSIRDLIRLFVSPAAQILSQHSSRKSLHC